MRERNHLDAIWMSGAKGKINCYFGSQQTAGWRELLSLSLCWQIICVYIQMSELERVRVTAGCCLPPLYMSHPRCPLRCQSVLARGRSLMISIFELFGTCSRISLAEIFWLIINELADIKNDSKLVNNTKLTYCLILLKKNYINISILYCNLFKTQFRTYIKAL